MTQATNRELREEAVPGSTVPRYELDDWRREFGLVAGITGRRGDFDMKLGPRPGTASQTVKIRWQSLLKGFGSAFDGVAVSRQVHGTRLGMQNRPSRQLDIQEDIDGHVTCQPGLLLAITVADCVPVYLLHPGSFSLALLHAGWRGIAAGILDAGVEKLCEVAHATPQTVVMHCGVGICGSCYQVGPEVVEAVGGAHVDGPESLDLRDTLVSRARDLGIRRVTVSPWCTAHDRGDFYSHRASGGRDGRMAAYVGRPAA